MNASTIPVQPVAQPPRGGNGPVIWLSSTAAGCAIVLCAVLVLIVPRFMEVFADFDTELPNPTKFVVGLGNWAAGAGPDGIRGTGDEPRIPGAAVILGLAALFCFAVVSFSYTEAGRGSIKSLAVVGVPLMIGLLIATVAFMGLALYIPFVKIVQHVAA